MSLIVENEIKEIFYKFENSFKKFEGKTILITGGNGFIGSYFVDYFAECNKFLENKINLIIVNKNPIKKESRLFRLTNDLNVKFITADMGKPFFIPKGVNIIIHAASRANPKSFSEDPLDTIDANVVGIRNLLDYARIHPVDDFIFFSTNEIYGNPLENFIPTPESYPGNVDPLDEKSCYAESKRLAENLCMIYYKKFNVPVKILRILLVYGPGMRDDGKVITDFFSKSLKERKIVFKDKGDSMRSFCYISDAMDSMLRIMHNGKSGEAYNVGNDLENISIKNLAKVISKITNNGTVVETNENAETKIIYGVNNRHPDISKIRALGFEPKTSLESGLRKLYDHFRENNSF